jgi:tetratricopeptide (TPR) repeat protein
LWTGRPEEAVGYAEAAVALHTDPHYLPFGNGWASFREANAHFYAGRGDRYLEICTALATQTGLAHVVGLCGLAIGLPVLGRSDDAIAIAEEAINAARAHANPHWIAYAYLGYGRAFAEADPARSLDTFREGLTYSREHGLPYFEALIARDAAGLEAVHGDLDQALNLFTTSLDSFHQAGDTASLAWTFARLAVFFDRTNQPEIAATIYGTTTHHPYTDQIDDLAAALDHLHQTLDAKTFDRCVRTGAAMNLTEAVHYAHHHINTTRQHQS